MKEAMREAGESLKDVEKIQPAKFSYFTRAKLFVFMDVILTSNFISKKQVSLDISKNELEEILGLCEDYCKLYHAWLSALPGTFKAVSWGV